MEHKDTKTQRIILEKGKNLKKTLCLCVFVFI